VISISVRSRGTELPGPLALVPPAPYKKTAGQGSGRRARNSRPF
jgi:hypothetical protein